MSKLLPPDQLERDKIINLLDKNLLVEAGAGSGKTSSLVGRMLAQIKAGNLGVSELAAVTFTRKAAAELRGRFQNQLELEFRQAEAGVVKERLGSALADLDQCFLGTIHAFCGKLLRERPLEAGLDPEFKELDEVQNGLLQERAWQSYLQQVDPPLVAQLEAIGVTPADLRTSFGQLCNYTDVEIVAQKVPRPKLQACVDQVAELVRRVKTAVPAAPPAKGYDSLQTTILKVERQLKFFDLSKDVNRVRVLKSLDKEPKITQNRWASAAAAKQYREEVWTLLETEVRPVLQAWREYCHPYLMEFVLPAVEHFAQLRAKLGYLNFDDLLARTAKMLAENSEVRQYFQQKYRCLLVDEFQDTDPLQAQIMFYLTGSEVQEREWQKLVPRPGSLFVVGDPKQSIYRFRRADIDIYNLVKKLLISQGGECLKLVANFRSVRGLGAWFNPAFSKLLPAEGTCYQAEFTELCTMQENCAGVSGVRVLDIQPESGKSTLAVVQPEAQLIARYIKATLAGSVKVGMPDEPQPKDFMILTRYKDSMDVYARALQSYGIPVAMTGGSSLQEMHELREVAKLLQLLKDPTDQVLLIAVLRGLFFGVSDEQLYRFRQAGGRFAFLAPGLGAMETVFAKLREYYHWSQTFAPAVVLEKLLTDLGLIPYALQGGLQRCSYVYQLLERVRWLEAQGSLDYGAMVEHFVALLEGQVEEELSLQAEDRNAVRIMNLHKAKGLEAAVVFLAHPAKRTSMPIYQHIKRTGPVPEGYFVLTKKVGFQQEVLGQPVGWFEHEAEEDKFLAAEEQRLLYVAATRAKHLLVVSRNVEDVELKKNPWQPLLAQLTEAGVLEVPEVEAQVEAGRERTAEAMPRFEQDWIATLAAPSVVQSTPSGLKTEAELAGVKRLEGGGMAWGTAVHRVLEQLVTSQVEAAELELALQENGLELEKLTELQAVVERFKASGLYQAVQQASVKYAEVPFSLQVESSNPLWELVSGPEQLPVVLTGVIDLVYQGPQGWEIVDYKTDRVVDEADIQQLLTVYGRQVEVYCQVWEQLTGEAVKRGQLYFTEWQGGKEFEVR